MWQTKWWTKITTTTEKKTENKMINPVILGVSKISGFRTKCQHMYGKREKQQNSDK